MYVRMSITEKKNIYLIISPKNMKFMTNKYNNVGNPKN